MSHRDKVTDVNSQAANKLGEKHVIHANISTGPTAWIRLRLAREILQKHNSSDVGDAEMRIETAWSHLVAHKNAPRLVWEAFSEASVVPTIRLEGGRHTPPLADSKHETAARPRIITSEKAQPVVQPVGKSERLERVTTQVRTALFDKRESSIPPIRRILSRQDAEIGLMGNHSPIDSGDGITSCCRRNESVVYCPGVCVRGQEHRAGQ